MTGGAFGLRWVNNCRFGRRKGGITESDWASGGGGLHLDYGAMG